MKIPSLLAALMCAVPVAERTAAAEAGAKIYECRYLADAPFGVLAWAQSDFRKDPKVREARFVDYNSDAAQKLVLDATAERDVTKDDLAQARSTSFSMAYDEKGWSIYIEGEEPLLDALLDAVVDPRSPALREGYEIFFTPGLHDVPYYQIMTRTFAPAEPQFVDWGMPHRHYRSLKGFARVEALPLEKRAGTFVFIPWEALYEYVPYDGATWRFSVIRWMPFGKAGGVTWGGKVHDTGNFGLVRFEAPPPEVRRKIERRLLRHAWFKFLAESRDQAAFWSDEKLGDAAFFETVLQPEIARNTEAGAALGDPDAWSDAAVQSGWKHLGDWMEFRYLVADLRNDYLVNKRFAETR